MQPPIAPCLRTLACTWKPGPSASAPGCWLIGKELAPIRIEYDVLGRAEECDGEREQRDRGQIELRIERAEYRQRDGER